VYCSVPAIFGGYLQRIDSSGGRLAIAPASAPRGALALYRFVAFLFVLLLPWHVFAHASRATSANPTGIAIPSLSHGEMAVLANYRGEIRSLAAAVRFTDPIFRTLMNYGAIQFSYCLWGMAPAAISDETSPFNECAHAYLSADKALLLHMRDMAPASSAVEALVSEIDAAMIKAGAAFIGCQYSGEIFDTAEFVTPHWEQLPTHLPSIAALGLSGFLLVSPFALRAAMNARRSSHAADQA
jgi:hypothetical protein